MGRQVRHFQPHCYYLVSNHCHGNEARLAPSPYVNQLLSYWLMRACEIYRVHCAGFFFANNQFYLLVCAPHGTLSAFMQCFQQGITTHLNMLHERTGSIFTSRYRVDAEVEPADVQHTLRELFLHTVDAFGFYPDFWPGLSSWRYHEDNVEFSLSLETLLVPSLIRSQERAARQHPSFTGDVTLNVPTLDDVPSLYREICARYQQRTQLVSHRPPVDPRQEGPAQWPMPHSSAYKKRQRHITRDYQQAHKHYRNNRSYAFPVGTVPPGHRYAIRARRSPMPRRRCVGQLATASKVLGIKLAVVGCVHVDKFCHLE